LLIGSEGINQWEFELAAWLDDGFLNTIVAKKFNDNAFTYFLRITDPDQGWEVWAVAGTAGRPPRFPWGYDVLPD